jgi:hypothetical protein
MASCGSYAEVEWVVHKRSVVGAVVVVVGEELWKAFEDFQREAQQNSQREQESGNWKLEEEVGEVEGGHDPAHQLVVLATNELEIYKTPDLVKVVEEANLYKAARPVTFQDGVNQREGEGEAPMLNRKNAVNFAAQVHKHVAWEHFHELLQKSANKADPG